MKEQQELPDILTADEVAAYLRVSRTTVCRWCSDGKLPAFRIGRGWRITRDDFEQHIKRSRDEHQQQEIGGEPHTGGDPAPQAQR
jgi:excisionase family DNA binding protein